MMKPLKSLKLIAVAGVAALGLAAFVPAANAGGSVNVGIGVGAVFAPPVAYPQTYYAPPIA